jgi:hypothetical protein
MEIPKEIADNYEIVHCERPIRTNKTPEPCDGCSKLVVDRHVDYRKFKASKKMQSHWRIKCRVCAMYYNPESGLWNLPNTATSNHKLTMFYERFYKKDK